MDQNISGSLILLNSSTIQTITTTTLIFESNIESTECMGDKNETKYYGTFLPTGYSLISTVLLCVFVALFCVYGFLGNMAVIFVILKDKYLSRHSQNMYLISMAVADALLCILVIPFSLSQELLGTWLFGNTYCKIYLAVDVMLCTASIWNICVIGLDRYWSINRPLSNRKMRTRDSIKIAIMVVWVTSCVISIPPFFSSLNKIPSINDTSCNVNDDTWYIVMSSILSFYLPAMIILPVYGKIYLIGRRHARRKIGQKLRSHSTNPPPNSGYINGARSDPGVYICQDRRSMSHLQIPWGKGCTGSHHIEMKSLHSDVNDNIQIINDEGSAHEAPTTRLMYGNDSTMPDIYLTETIKTKHKKKPRLSTQSNVSLQIIKNVVIRKISNSKLSHIGARERRFTLIILVVMGCFMICWTPFFTTYVVYAICREKCCISKVTFKAFFWLGYMNSGFNPAIYTIFNEDFRNAFKKLFNKMLFCC